MTGCIFISMFNNAWISKQIAKAIGGWSSHSFVVRAKWDMEQKHSTLETTDYQVANRIFEQEYLLPECKFRGYEILNRSHLEKLEAMQDTDYLIDERYGYLRMLGYLIKLGLKLKNNPVRDGVWCTTVPLVYLKNLDFEWAKHINDENVDTKILESLLLSHPESFRLKYHKPYGTTEMETYE